MELSDITTPALAYLGDSVLEVCVRTYLVTERGLSTSAHLNRASLDFVRASAQSEAVGRMEPRRVLKMKAMIPLSTMSRRIQTRARARPAAKPLPNSLPVRFFHKAGSLKSFQYSILFFYLLFDLNRCCRRKSFFLPHTPSGSVN